jgi:hypothetical protein
MSCLSIGVMLSQSQTQGTSASLDSHDSRSCAKLCARTSVCFCSQNSEVSECHPFSPDCIKGQSREIVGGVLKFMQKEADEHKFVIPVSKVHELVTSTTGVSKSSIKTIKKEMLNLQAGAVASYSTPKGSKTWP